MGRRWSSFTVPAEGISGGLILLWKTAVGYVDVVTVSRYAAHMVVSSKEGETWLMTAVYASNQLEQQKLLWEELVGLGNLGLPWLVGGDFNAILAVEEKRSRATVTLGPKSSNFAKFVEEAGVCDLGYEGVPFTWCNNQSGDNRIWVRLDRALANPEWVRMFPGSRVLHLDRSSSDHAPLLVQAQGTPERRRRPFRFELYWMEYKECRDIIARSWRGTAHGNPMHGFNHKIMNMQRYLGLWSKAGLGCLETEMKAVRMEIQRLEERDAREELDAADFTNLRCCYNRRAALSRQINLKWLQRSRLKWVQEGDRNTHFFHLTTTLRGRRNKIQRLRSKEGEWTQDQEHIAKEFLEHYEELWGPNTAERWELP
ncbi:uncharacterized protein [Typha angustifolia]|uniref:uncharacterized protein n=1 Tax=Typha angustifolia TaxID=59011 RepID=UPI003C2AEAA0